MSSARQGLNVSRFCKFVKLSQVIEYVYRILVLTARLAVDYKRDRVKSVDQREEAVTPVR
ncbi:hypothetical protein [Mesotoga sp. Brook.08.YT.4.2.5.1]|uniref:hypothetical protein n=1 Tax=Mesotoga sp. Brook.08.YT.4.2.5.1 TaxID=1421001 RepID=UPI000E0C3DE5|nr:hypothetical protein [Mesotoga sp. Brook.08.YT.4.2.5.1]